MPTGPLLQLAMSIEHFDVLSRLRIVHMHAFAFARI